MLSDAWGVFVVKYFLLRCGACCLPPVCGCQECVAGVGGEGVLREGLGKKWGPTEGVRMEGMGWGWGWCGYVWESCVCSAGQRGHGGGGGGAVELFIQPQC